LGDLGGDLQNYGFQFRRGIGEGGRENRAQRLMNGLQQLARALGLLGNETTATANTPQDYLNFLIEVLQKVEETI
jgi:hypothetical protein